MRRKRRRRTFLHMQRKVCEICTESKRKDQMARCIHCVQESCKKCFAQYLMVDGTKPKMCCMFCSSTLSKEYIRGNTTKNEYIQIRKRVLLYEFNQKVMSEKHVIMQMDAVRKQATSKLNETLKERRELKRLIDTNMQRCAELRNTIRNPHITPNTSYVKHCCLAECNAILDDQLRCTQCGYISCENCLSAYKKDESHHCSKRAMEDAQSLKKEAKPCPQCSTFISKVEGCDQMWCVECKTAFSWRTGAIMNSESIMYENPHRSAFLRQQVKGYYHYGIFYKEMEPSYSKLRSHLLKFVKQRELPKDYVHNVMAIKQNVAELHHALHTITERVNNTKSESFEDRLRYITHEVNDARMANMLWKHEQHHEKWLALRKILDEYVVKATDQLQELLSQLKATTSTVDTFYHALEPFDTINMQFNMSMDAYSAHYRCVIPYYICTQDWQLQD